MKINYSFPFKNGFQFMIDGSTLWNDNVVFNIGDILVCGDKKWKMVGINPIFEGCFGIPKYRTHLLELEPLNHQERPQVGDLLEKEIK
jgi:hypothetical protein